MRIYWRYLFWWGSCWLVFTLCCLLFTWHWPGTVHGIVSESVLSEMPLLLPALYRHALYLQAHHRTCSVDRTLCFVQPALHRHISWPIRQLTVYDTRGTPLCSTTSAQTQVASVSLSKQPPPDLYQTHTLALFAGGHHVGYVSFSTDPPQSFTMLCMIIRQYLFWSLAWSALFFGIHVWGQHRKHEQQWASVRPILPHPNIPHRAIPTEIAACIYTQRQSLQTLHAAYLHVFDTVPLGLLVWQHEHICYQQTAIFPKLPRAHTLDAVFGPGFQAEVEAQQRQLYLRKTMTWNAKEIQPGLWVDVIATRCQWDSTPSLLFYLLPSDTRSQEATHDAKQAQRDRLCQCMRQTEDILASPLTLTEVLETTEQHYLHAAYRLSRGNITFFADLLGVSRRTAYRKLQKVTKNDTGCHPCPNTVTPGNTPGE